jgi:hypothetical protein
MPPRSWLTSGRLLLLVCSSSGLASPALAAAWPPGSSPATCCASAMAWLNAW